MPFPENDQESGKTERARAVANGSSVAARARGNAVPKRTTYRWSREPKVRAAVESYRRRADTHNGASLYEAFPPAEARRLLDRLEDHPTRFRGYYFREKL